MLLRLLQDAQRVRGYLDHDDLELVALRAGAPLYAVWEFASFFPSFHLREPGGPVLRVCQSMVCHLAWQRQGVKELRDHLKTAWRGAGVAVEGVSCLGRCDRAPVAVLHRPGPQSPHAPHGDQFYGALTKLGVNDFRTGAADVPGEEIPHGPAATAPEGCTLGGRPEDADLRYVTLERYEQARPKAAAVIDLLEWARLVGLGGGAGNIGKKWRQVIEPGGHTVYVVANGDESEPGTFKDREVMGRFPHRVVEGVLIAGRVLQARRVYVYVRHEYSDQIAALRAEVDRVRSGGRGTVAAAALQAHPVEVVESPGRYICGEETALLEVLEGRRAQPRNNPDDLIRRFGLFGHPTAVNNVETFARIPGILTSHGEQLAAGGAPKGDPESPRRLFSVSGDVVRPGVYEMAENETMADLLAAAGGVPDGLELRAIAPSGPSGGFYPPAEVVGKIPQTACCWPLDARKLKGDGNVLLGGGVVFYAAPAGERGSMDSHAVNCLEFFRDESCGKCVPCRLGTEQLVALGVPHGRGAAADAAREIADTMKATSICGLGRTAPRPLETVLRYFPPPAGSP